MPSIAEITEKLQVLYTQSGHIEDKALFFHETSSLIQELSLEIRRLELAGYSRDSLINELKHIREIHGRSPFIARFQNWPRGYKGDFETIEYLCDGENRSKPDTLEYYLEQIALSSPIVQQHRNKVCWQAQNIIQHVLNKDSVGGVLLVGSGPCRDLRLIQPLIASANINLVINDIDGDAIEYSRTELGSIWNKVTPVIGDSFRRSKEIAKHGPFRLMVAGGLFDYLPDKYAGKLISNLMKMLSVNGELILTNILKGNPWRTWLQYLVDWPLIERDETDFRRILDQNNMRQVSMKMVKDSTSLAGLYTFSNQLLN